MDQLVIQDLHVSIADQEIIRGLSLRVPKGQVHAIMGPNGSGKSTLAKVLAGHPDYAVTAGSVTMDGEKHESCDITVTLFNGETVLLSHIEANIPIQQGAWKIFNVDFTAAN